MPVRPPRRWIDIAASTEAVAYLYPRASRDGRTTVGVVNRKLGLGLAIRYNTREFPRCVNWQHWGPGEYVTALEPTNGTVQGRAKDREQRAARRDPGGRAEDVPLHDHHRDRPQRHRRVAIAQPRKVKVVSTERRHREHRGRVQISSLCAL